MAAFCSSVAASPVSVDVAVSVSAGVADNAGAVAAGADGAPPARAAGHAACRFDDWYLALYLSSHARLHRGSKSSMKIPSSLQHFTNASLCAPSAALPAVIPPCALHSPFASLINWNLVVPGGRTNSALTHVTTLPSVRGTERGTSL